VWQNFVWAAVANRGAHSFHHRLRHDALKPALAGLALFAHAPVEFDGWRAEKFIAPADLPGCIAAKYLD
jgi:hypothetical protein